MAFIRLRRPMLTRACVVVNLRKKDNHARRHRDPTRFNRRGNYVTNVMAQYQFLLLVKLFIFLIRSRRSRPLRERRSKEAGPRGSVVEAIKRLLFPGLRTLNVQGFKIVSTRPQARGPMRAINRLNNRCSFERWVRRLFPNLGRPLRRVSVSLHLSTKNRTVGRTCQFLNGRIISNVRDAVLHLAWE